jgi:hypothetical protein
MTLLNAGMNYSLRSTYGKWFTNRFISALSRTLSYFKSAEMLRHSVRLIIHSNTADSYTICISAFRSIGTDSHARSTHRRKPIARSPALRDINPTNTQIILNIQNDISNPGAALLPVLLFNQSIQTADTSDGLHKQPNARSPNSAKAALTP